MRHRSRDGKHGLTVEFGADASFLFHPLADDTFLYDDDVWVLDWI